MAESVIFLGYLRLIFGELIPVLKENHTNPLTWSLVLRPDTLYVTRRIRKYVLKGEAVEAWRLKESYKDTFAMLAVAAAIIAQISISLLGLSDFGNIHWTATAFAYTSLISGLFSTFFSFYVQQILGNLHCPEDVYEWLTTPRMTFINRIVNILRRRERTPRPADRADRIPSLTAAAALTAPSGLLTISIGSLFLSLGVYLGSVYTQKLGSLKGENANLAVLLFFIIFVTTSIIEIALPLSSKQVEQLDSLLERDEKEPGLQSMGLRIDEAGAAERGRISTSAGVLEKDIAIRQALQASIRAQEESLKAQKALLQLLL